MRVWIFHNNCTLPEHGHFTRAYCLGKYLERQGDEPVVFVGSHPHNSDIQLIEDKSRFKVYREKPFPWVLVKTCNYGESKIKRVFSMLQFYFNGKKAAKHFTKPDAIVGSSSPLFVAALAVKLAKKLHTKSIVEIRDIWPESIVEYGVAGNHNPFVVLMRMLEKWVYKNADAIVFVAGGFNDYIKEKGWEKIAPPEKVYTISNGVDLEDFNTNLAEYRLDDADLDNPDTFKVVYTGSVRRVNNLGLLLDAAKCVNNPRIRFIIYGTGNEIEMLKKRVSDEHIDNVVFKGHVDKRYIPYITNCADLNIAHNNPAAIFRFGISFNKIFDYMAAGKPILCDFPCRYNPVIETGCGMSVDEPTAENIARAIEHFAEMEKAEYDSYCERAKQAAKIYSFESHAKRLAEIAEKINSDGENKK